MSFPLEFAHLAGPPGFAVLRLGFVLTVIALAFLVRQPASTNDRKRNK